MSSLPSSSAPSDTPAELINKILNTQANEPDFNLSRFVAQIDLLLRQLQRKKKPIREKLGDLPSASEASNFAEQVSNNVQLIAKEIKEYSGNKHETSIKVLNAIGNVHWVAVGFLLVGAALKIADTMEHNKKECLRLLKSMRNLSNIISQLQVLPDLKKVELQDKLKESIQLIVEGAILCCSQKKRNLFNRAWKASDHKQELQQLSRDMDEMRDQLQLQLITCTYTHLNSVTPPSDPMFNQDAVGIVEKIEEVIQLLDWESDSRTAAVVVYGIGGSGKTTLADAVYYSLKEKLHGWSHSKIILIQNLEKHPKIEDRQSLILQDLTCTKQDVRDIPSGQQRLKEIIEKGPIFIYIDNALYLEPLKDLLPKDVTSAKKLRILLTARETNVSGVIRSCGIESCKLYDVGSLSVDASIQALCRKIDNKSEKESMLKERPQIRQIAEKCSCCPLFLELIGAYLQQRNNKVEFYENVLHSLEVGNFFSGSVKYNFDESRVLFAYEELNPSAQEAFLDICSFFFDWKWQEVAWIVGDEEMESLQEGALIKKEGEEINIHDLILTAGRHKSKDNRFNDANAFSVALKNKERVSQIKGVWLPYMEGPLHRLHISAEELDAMSGSLRVFHLGKEVSNLTTMKGKCGEQFKELRFLLVESNTCNLPFNIFNLNQLRCLSIAWFNEDVVLSRYMKLPNLKVLRVRWSMWERNGRQIVHGIGEIAGLRSLKQLDLDTRNADGISQCFTNLHHLQRLRLTSEFTELPESLVRLQSLQKLDLSGCGDLKQLPAGFGELTSLTELNLSYCRSLQELPCDLEKLTSLQSLNIRECSSLLCLPAGLGNSTSLTFLIICGCSRLTCLPRNLGGLMSALGSEIDFEGCSSLSELPEDICKHTMLTSISLRQCRKLKGLPSRFGELTCLQRLDLGGCESLEELCNDFHLLRELRELNLENCKSLSCLPLGFGKLSSLIELSLENCESLSRLPQGFGKLSSLETLYLNHCKSLSSLPQGFGKLSSLKTLYLSDCKSLSRLPSGFGKLSSLETLDLSECVNLEELCSDFHCLGALKYLELSDCDSLCDLPDRFGELSCLESLNLSRCSNLEKLPDGFGELSCLKWLDLPGCSNLEKLSDDFHLLQSLIKLNLSKCGSLAGEWMDKVWNMKSLWLLDIVGSERMIEQWMETKSQIERNLVVVTQGNGWYGDLLLEGLLSNVFDEEGFLVDADERPFYSSSLQLQTPIIFIIGSDYGYHRELGKNLQQLQTTSKKLQIIYVGRHFKSSSSELAITILAHTPDNSSFLDKFYDVFKDVNIRAVFRSTDELKENGLKCLSAWEDISSYMFDRVKFLSNTPQESNIELLNELLATEKTDYLLLNKNRQVKIASLQGKLILLLFAKLNEVWCISAVQEMYLKMQDSHNYVVELVWVPITGGNTWEEFERAAANAPWPVVPNPWLVDEKRIYSLTKRSLPCVCVVDEKGRISKKDAMPMIARWGLEAYPFSQDREDELTKAEWEAFKLNSLSTLQFVFPNLEDLSNKAKEMMDRGVMMLKLAPDSNCAFTMLETDLLLFYVARSGICAKENENDVSPTLEAFSFSYIDLFWRDVKRSLQEDVSGMGTNERIVKLRRMVLALYSKKRDSWDRYWYRRAGEWETRVVLVDGNGEMMISRRGMGVEAACDNEKDSKEKLVEDTKTRDVEKSAESRWRDGIIHPKHDIFKHLLLKVWNPDNWISCSVCGEERNAVYQCTECEKYVICEECEKDDMW